MLTDTIIRQITPEDLPTLKSLLGFEFFVHRHLDWNSPLDWYDQVPFLILEQDKKILAVLACPEDPPGVCWVHLFSSVNGFPPKQTWPILFAPILDYLKEKPHIQWLAAISLQSWFTTLLQENGFQHFQDIVVLELNLEQTRQIHVSLNTQIVIREMDDADLDAVSEVDRLSFHPLWQNTYRVLRDAWRLAAYSTVAQMEERIVAYQICTSSIYNAHLARLAVHPAFQRLGIASTLISNIYSHFKEQGANRLTVNTQSDNKSSLSLYHKIGFQLTGDSYPVFVFPQTNILD